jgi:hypothetical protein
MGSSYQKESAAARQHGVLWRTHERRRRAAGQIRLEALETWSGKVRCQPARALGSTAIGLARRYLSRADAARATYPVERLSKDCAIAPHQISPVDCWIRPRGAGGS